MYTEGWSMWLKHSLISILWFSVKKQKPVTMFALLIYLQSLNGETWLL